MERLERELSHFPAAQADMPTEMPTEMPKQGCSFQCDEIS
jgi:hypothetical protein